MHLEATSENLDSPITLGVLKTCPLSLRPYSLIHIGQICYERSLFVSCDATSRTNLKFGSRNKSYNLKRTNAKDSYHSFQILSIHFMGKILSKV